MTANHRRQYLPYAPARHTPISTDQLRHRQRIATKNSRPEVVGVQAIRVAVEATRRAIGIRIPQSTLMLSKIDDTLRDQGAPFL